MPAQQRRRSGRPWPRRSGSSPPAAAARSPARRAGRRAATSASRRPPASGPSGVSSDRQQGVGQLGGGDAGVALDRASRSRSRPARPRRSRRGEVGVLQHPVHQGAERRPLGQRRHRRRQVDRVGARVVEPVGRARLQPPARRRSPAARSRWPRPRSGGCVVQPGGQPGVRRAHPGRVDGRGRTARTASARVGRQRRLPGAARRRRPTLDGDRAAGPRGEVVEPAPHGPVVADGRRSPAPGPARRGRRTAAGAAARRGCCRRAPSAPPPGSGPGSARRRRAAATPRASSRDVQRPARVVPRARRAADVEHPLPAASCSRSGSGCSGHVLVPQEGRVDDRELQALAAVHGDHLHGRGVGLEPAAALLGHVVARPRRSAAAATRRATATPSGPRWRRRAAPAPTCRRSVSRRSPRSVASTRSTSPAPTSSLEQGGDPALDQHLGPRVQPGAELVEGRVVVGREQGASQPDEVGQRRGRARGRAAAAARAPRAGSASPRPRRRGRRWWCWSARRVRRRRPARRGPWRRPRCAGRARRRRRARTGRAPSPSPSIAPEDSSRDDVGGDVTRRRTGASLTASTRRCAGPQRSRSTTRSRHGRVARRAAQPAPRWAASTGCTAIRSSPSAAPPSTCASALDQRRVAAPVGAQRRGDRGGAGGAQVGDHVGAAERVDRLLRVADQHQRAVPVEGALEDLPLHRVGVLELVDEHDR